MTVCTEGFADVIRTALRASSEPMTLDEIARGYVGTVNANELSAIRRGLSAILRQRVVAGEVIRHHSTEGLLRYSLNLEHHLRGRSTSAAKAKKATSKAVHAGTVPPPAVTPEAPAGEPEATAALPVLVPAVDVSRMTITPLEPDQDERDFVRRLVDLCAGLEDLIGEACDARLDHDFIKALIVSQGAAHRALRICGQPG